MFSPGVNNTSLENTNSSKFGFKSTEKIKDNYESGSIHTEGKTDEDTGAVNYEDMDFEDLVKSYISSGGDFKEIVSKISSELENKYSNDEILKSLESYIEE